MDEAHDKLHRAIQKRDALDSEIRRLEGMLEAAQNELRRVEEECRRRKVDPENIDEVIQKLETAYVQGVDTLEQRLSEIESELAPFLDITGENR